MNGLIATLIVTASGVGAATSDSNGWIADYGKALTAARRDGRPLLIVLDKPGNPAESIDDSPILRAPRQQRMLAKYELCRVDVSTRKGKRVAEAFGATQFPFTAVTDTSCSVIVSRTAGKQTEQSWTRILLASQSEPVAERSTRRVARPRYPMTWGAACFS